MRSPLSDAIHCLLQTCYERIVRRETHMEPQHRGPEYSDGKDGLLPLQMGRWAPPVSETVRL